MTTSTSIVLSTLPAPLFTSVVVTLQHLPAISVNSPPSVEPSLSSDRNIDFLLKFKLLLKSLFLVFVNIYCSAESVASTLTSDMLQHIVINSRHTLITILFSSSDPCTLAPDTICVNSSLDNKPVSNKQPTITKKNNHLQIVPLKANMIVKKNNIKVPMKVCLVPLHKMNLVSSNKLVVKNSMTPVT